MVTLKMQCRAKRVDSQQDGPEKRIKIQTDEGEGSDRRGELLLLLLHKKTFVCYSCEARGEEEEEGGAVNSLRLCLWLKSADAQRAQPEKYQRDEAEGREEAPLSVFSAEQPEMQFTQDTHKKTAPC